MNTWRCGRCGRSGQVGDEVAQVWHRCEPPRGPRRAVTLGEIFDGDGPPTIEELRRARWRDDPSPFVADLAAAIARTERRRSR